MRHSLHGIRPQLNLALAPQALVAAWRSKTFKSIDVKVDAVRRATSLSGWCTSIFNEWSQALEKLPGEQFKLPSGSQSRLKSLLDDAYSLNRRIKGDVVRFDYQVFSVEPLSDWDRTQMESFNAVSAVWESRPIACCVALGLICAVALGNGRTSHVLTKAQVLVEDGYILPPIISSTPLVVTRASLPGSPVFTDSGISASPAYRFSISGSTTLGHPLPSFPKLIDEHRSLQRARVISTEAYAAYGGGVTHRFVVLELRRSGKKTLWLRLDRRRGKGVSTFDLLRRSGSTPSNDMVRGQSILRVTIKLNTCLSIGSSFSR